MLMEAECETLVAGFDRETRLALAHSACLMLALDPGAVPQRCGSRCMPGFFHRIPCHLLSSGHFYRIIPHRLIRQNRRYK